MQTVEYSWLLKLLTAGSAAEVINLKSITGKAELPKSLVDRAVMIIGIKVTITCRVVMYVFSCGHLLCCHIRHCQYSRLL